MTAHQSQPIQPPVIVVDDLDVSLHPSLDDAALQVEAPDLADCHIYDSEGRLLKATARGNSVRLEPDEHEPCHASNSLNR